MRTEELLALGVFGRRSRLGDRVETLLARGRDFSARPSPVRVAASLAALLGCVFAGSLAPCWIAFAETGPSFEVASVRAAKPGEYAEPVFDVGPASLTVRRYSLRDLMAWAYRLDRSEISGVNLDAGDFDLTAKASEAVSPDQLRLMLQVLLEQRFKIALHREQRIVPLYTLTAEKGGPKMPEAKEARNGGWMGYTDRAFTYKMIGPVARLTEILPDFLDNRPVRDSTGLTGIYEINLSVEMDPDQIRRVPQPGVVFSGFGYAPGVFDAVAKLGLKLVAEKGPMDFLVVDHAEQLDAN